MEYPAKNNHMEEELESHLDALKAKLKMQASAMSHAQKDTMGWDQFAGDHVQAVMSHAELYAFQLDNLALGRLKPSDKQDFKVSKKFLLILLLETL